MALSSLKPLFFCLNLEPCGSGLARESGVSADINAEFDGLFAGKPAPTGGGVCY
jgi:hypothetical protein